MKKFIVLAMALTSLRSLALTETQKNEIVSDFTTANQTISAQVVVGQYTGICFDQYVESNEALYVNSFTNIKGETQVLPMATSQFYGGFELPEKLQHLASGDVKNLKDVATFVRKGFTGVDNNVGHVGQGGDYAYVYNATLSADQSALTLKVSDVKTTDDLTAPILRGCEYGQVNGAWAFQGCFANNDQTVFKKTASGQLVSLRTADERVKGTNLLSFRLPAIAKYCTWSKIN
ncbi:hypothetical protein CIK05_11415 [Bdellovibrio sp. qaytius]|nr:hypothetical protein CIK05_11415 [Bdellovibrio sp. qaytius]